MTVTISAPQETGKRPGRRSGNTRSVALAYGVAALLFVIATVISPSFASMTNIGALLLLAAIIGVASLGQTFVIVGGGIDLSIPWLMTCSAVLTSRFADGDSARLVWLLPLMLLAGGIVGVINGFGVARLKIAPIVMTLGMGGILQGGLLTYTQGKGSPAAPEFLVTLASEGIGPVRWAVILWVVLGAAATLILGRGVFGRELYAVGSSRTVAEFSGLNSARITILTYALSGAAGTLAGMLLLGYTGQSFLSMGNPYLFSSVAAVAIGGTSILGGTGSYLGTAGGALILTVLTALLLVLNLSQGALPIVYGAVIVVAIVAAAGRLQRSRA